MRAGRFAGVAGLLLLTSILGVALQGAAIGEDLAHPPTPQLLEDGFPVHEAQAFLEVLGAMAAGDIGPWLIDAAWLLNAYLDLLNSVGFWCFEPWDCLPGGYPALPISAAIGLKEHSERLVLEYLNDAIGAFTGAIGEVSFQLNVSAAVAALVAALAQALGMLLQDAGDGFWFLLEGLGDGAAQGVAVFAEAVETGTSGAVLAFGILAVVVASLDAWLDDRSLAGLSAAPRAVEVGGAAADGARSLATDAAFGQGANAVEGLEGAMQAFVGRGMTPLSSLWLLALLTLALPLALVAAVAEAGADLADPLLPDIAVEDPERSVRNEVGPTLGFLTWLVLEPVLEVPGRVTDNF